MLDLRALRYFIAAVETGSISAAAKQCHVAQPSITLAIAKLEENFNTKLLDRTRRGVRTTERGQRFFEQAIELMLHADAIEVELRSTPIKLSFTISLNQSIQISYIGKIIPLLKKINSNIELELVESPDQADIHISTKASAPANLTFYPLMMESYALLIPNTNPLAHKHSLELNDLEGQGLIERRHCENRALFEHFLSQTNLDLPIVANVDNEEWALSLVASGLGICFSPLPQNYQDSRFRIVGLETLLGTPGPQRQIGLYVSHNMSSQKQSILEQLIPSLISPLTPTAG